MLVLSRRVNEALTIEVAGQVITITVMAVERYKVRLGIDAPREWPVFRKELLEEKDERTQWTN